MSAEMRGFGGSIASLSGDRPIALVTGGAKRVGRAISLEFAARGLDVILTYARSVQSAERTVAEIGELGTVGVALEMPLDDPLATQRAAGALAETLPRLDVLVHNASTYEPSPLGNLNLDQATRQHAVNAMSPLALSTTLAPRMRTSPGNERRGASIVAMLDVHTETLPRADHAAYAMSKGALSGLVRSLATDLAPDVRVNALAPGVIAWPESGEESDPDVQARYLSRVPLERSGTPEEAAKAVAFLALDATYTTGHVLTIDGGRHLR